MSDDNVMYDSPLEFMNDAASSEECVAQSAIPVGDAYVCACVCDEWQVTAASLEEGLTLAKRHAGVQDPSPA
ncbi:hypothetical protein [Nocardia sp. NPDC005366]|uniref:hypothetical protein n=1 Tax=Nocardia sp. NPDC005366 TaxID=3156878 RepID=UPI00339E6E51